MPPPPLPPPRPDPSPIVSPSRRTLLPYPFFSFSVPSLSTTVSSPRPFLYPALTIHLFLPLSFSHHLTFPSPLLSPHSSSSPLPIYLPFLFFPVPLKLTSLFLTTHSSRINAQFETPSSGLFFFSCRGKIKD